METEFNPPPFFNACDETEDPLVSHPASLHVDRGRCHASGACCPILEVEEDREGPREMLASVLATILRSRFE